MRRATLAVCVCLACSPATQPATTVTVAPLPTPSDSPATTDLALPQMAAMNANADTAPEVLAPGKVTVVHFFASWCAPCGKSLPELDALYEHRGGHSLAIVAIGEDDDQASMRAFVANYGIVYTVLWDGAKAKAERWKLTTMPTTFVVDKHGATRFTHAGYRPGDAASIDAELTTLLAEP